MKSALPACDAPDELSDVAQHRRQNSQTRRKGADQGEMSDPVITPLLGNPAMGVDPRCHSAAVAGTDQAIAPRRDQQRGRFLAGDEGNRLRFRPIGAAENGAQDPALDWQEIIWTG
jgi:hypothetical protein